MGISFEDLDAYEEASPVAASPLPIATPKVSFAELDALSERESRGMEAGGSISNVAEDIAGGIGSVTQGLSLSGAHEITSGAESLAEMLFGPARSYVAKNIFGFDSPVRSYDEILAKKREDQRAFEERHPYVSTGLEVAGGLALPFGAVSKEGSLLNKAISGATTSAAMGVPYGFLSAEGGFEPRAESALTSGLISAGAGAVLPVLGAATGKVGKKLQSIANKSELESYGITTNDLGKTLKSGVGRAEKKATGLTPLERAVEEVRPSGMSYASPTQQLQIAEEAVTSLNSQIENIITTVDDAVQGQGQFLPTFDNAAKFVESLKGTERVAMQKRLIEEAQALLANDLDGSLRSVHEAKKAFNSKGYSVLSDASERKLNQKIAQDLKETVEKGIDSSVEAGVVPSELKGLISKLNREESNYLQLIPFAQKQQLKEQTQGLGRTLTKMIRTSGAPTGVPILAAASSGNPLWLAAAGLGAAATSRKGQQLLSKTGRGLGGLMEESPSFFDRLNPAAIAQLFSSDEEAQASIPTVEFAPQMISAKRIGIDMPKQKEGEIVSLDGYSVDDILDGLRQVESGGGKYLKSPAGALGPYQFMPATWEEWGQGGDVMSEEDSREAAKRYLLWLYEKTGSLDKALQAYNFGIGNIQKGKALPQETKAYVPKIMAAIAALKGEA